MNKLLVAGIIVLVVLLGLWIIMAVRDIAPTPVKEQGEILDSQEKEPIQRTIDLSEQNNSGVSGFAYLVGTPDGPWVVLDLEGAPENAAQPAHIHQSTCEEIGGVLHALEFPVNGFSQTLLPVSLEELMANSPLSINIHKSTEEPQLYVACGNI